MPKPPKGMFRRGKSWYVRLYSGSSERKISLGPNFQEACKEYRRIKKGDLPVSGLNVGQAADRWLETYVRIARNAQNQRLATRRAEMYLKPAMGYKLIWRVSTEDIRRYRLWLESHEISPQTVAHILSDCRCLFGWAEDSGLISKSPVPKRLLPRIQEVPPDRLTEAEADVISALPAPYGFVCRFGLATGLRWGEMCRAQASDVRGGVLTVAKTKTGRLRRVPLPSEILEELRDRVGKVIPYSVRSSGSFARDVRKRSGIERFHVHQLRHTFACEWLERGGSLVALQQILGHASIVTTQRYARLADAFVLEEAKRVQTVPRSRPTSSCRGKKNPVIFAGAWK